MGSPIRLFVFRASEPTTATENDEGQRQRGEGADRKQRPTHGFPLGLWNTVCQQQPNPRAEQTARAGNEAHFRQRQFSFSHNRFLPCD
jgi:hypothetical protein